MKERGILFTKENRLASVECKKTQARQVIVPQPEYLDGMWRWQTNKSTFMRIPESPNEVCLANPRYQVDDHLYMKEPYRGLVNQIYSHKKYHYGEHLIEYVDTKETIKCPDELDGWWWKRWRKAPSTTTSSRFMYKSLTRYWFEVTQVRCERLQDISEADCLAEGIKDPLEHGARNVNCSEVTAYVFRQFQELWDSINKKRGYSFESNPFVWVYTYKRITK